MSQNSENKNDTNNNTTGRSPEGTGELICRDYQRGVCSRGSKCKFNHPDGMGTEVTNSPMICRDFQNGKCSRSTCKYLHLSNNEEKVFLRTGQMPPTRREMPGSGDRGEQTRAGPNDPICKDYLNRKCSRGQGCRYRHEDEQGGDFGGGGGGGYGFDGHPSKRRRDSYEGQNFYYLMDENDALRRRVADLQKQVTDLKATNEVLLEQNAKYRNQIGERGSYNGSGSSSARPADYPSSFSSSQSSYSTSYPPRESYASKDTYSGSYGPGKDQYTSPSQSSSAPFGATGSYTSNTAYGTGYTKFD